MSYKNWIKKLEKRFYNFTIVAVMYVIAVAILIGGLVNSYFAYTNIKTFDPWVTADAVEVQLLYLMGPFAGNDEMDVYIGADQNEDWFIIATELNTNLPIYGVTIDDDGIATMNPITLQGTSEYIEYDMQDYFVEFVNENGIDEITSGNVSDYVGYYYFDATNAGIFYYLSESLLFWILGGIMLFFAVIIHLAQRSFKKNLKESIASYEADGTLQKVYDDYIGSREILDEKNSQFILTDNYAMAFAGGKMTILTLQGVQTVYKSRITNRQFTKMWQVTLDKGNVEIQLDTKIPGDDTRNPKINVLVDRVRQHLQYRSNTVQEDTSYDDSI